MSRPAFSLLFLAFLAFFLGLGRAPITDADEAFYARASWEMVESGDWLTPRFNYEDRWQKPVLYYWLTAGLYRITGPTEWSARFWSALAGLGLVFLTWGMAARFTHRGDTALLAGAIVATCFGCFTLARMALPDLPLAYLVTLSIWAVLRAVDATGRPAAGTHATPGATAALDRVTVRRPPTQAFRWWALAGAAAGLGFLMKGPVALVIPAIVLLPIWWRERRTVTLEARGVAIAAIVAACVGLPWYVAMWHTHGAEYLRSFFIGDNLERFATDRFNEPRGVLYYLPVLVGGMVPWSAFLLVLPWRPLAHRLRGTVAVAAHEWRLIAWAAMPLLFYTLSLGKQPRYILPVLPPLAILLASVLARRVAEARAGRAAPDLTAATWGTAALLAFCAVALARTQPLWLDAYPWATWMGIGALGALAVITGAIAASRSWYRLTAALAVSAALLLVVVQFGALAGVRPTPVEQMAALVREHRQQQEPAGVYNVFVRNLVFYTGVRQEILISDEAAIDFLRGADRVLLVLPEADLARLEPFLEAPPRHLGRVRYVDTAGIRLGTLLRPEPERHVRPVVLITNW